MNIAKNKTAGFWFIPGAAAIALIAAVIYTIFGISSNTFNAVILIGLICAGIAGAIMLFTRGLLSNLLGIGMTALLSLSFTHLLGNSINDITEFITPTGLFGVAENVPMRAFLAVLILIAILAAIIGSFMKREKQ